MLRIETNFLFFGGRKLDFWNGIVLICTYIGYAIDVFRQLRTLWQYASMLV